MDISAILHNLNDDAKYRFHLAKSTTTGSRPLDALAKSEETWLGWQTYRGNAKERFTVDYIVSFAQISGRKFLFGGVFQITNRASTAKRYKVKRINEYSDLIGRLVLEYKGNNSRVTVFKPTHIYKNSAISAIYEYKFKGEPFISFEEINHNFNAVEIIVKNNISSWKVALSSVSGVYLISDKKTGKHYVGSAYGTKGLWGRWCSYINTFHGNNDDLIELFTKKSESYFRENFKFAILEVISSAATKEEVIHKESLWKSKLFTREHGHN